MDTDKAKEMAKLRREKGAVTNPIDRWRNKDTRKTAIEANCVFCVGGDHDPGYRTRIRECNVESCTLMKWRPYQ